ncbi:galactosylceramide sulfotransferase-like [Antedon mediterranea]|uniref:galactosylceramide sulfotransferase-like n=1 Tax=Antedon mediterranea TaxID=105859 RepID=UPI003AF821AC
MKLTIFRLFCLIAFFMFMFVGYVSVIKLTSVGLLVQYHIEEFVRAGKPLFIQVQPKCKPVKKIVYMKTHQTGSTTLAAILDRFAYNNQLTLPIYQGVTDHVPFRRSMVANQGKLDMLTSHTLYNKAEMDIAFPGAVYITIAREPSSHFESVFTYFGLAKRIYEPDPKMAIDDFLHEPSRYLTYSRSPFNRVWNGQMQEFGLKKHEFNDNKRVQQKIKELDLEFDLVLITEYFDESMILLKDFLCWNFEDVVYMSMNVRSERSILSKDSKRKIRSLSKADVAFYNHFNKTFWDKIHKKGKKFQKDLSEFKRIKKEYLALCLTNETTIKLHRINVSTNMNKLQAGLSADEAQETCGSLKKNHLEWSAIINDRMLKNGLVSYETFKQIKENSKKSKTAKQSAHNPVVRRLAIPKLTD